MVKRKVNSLRLSPAAACAGFVRGIAWAIALAAVGVALASEPATRPAAVTPAESAMLDESSSPRMKADAWANTVTALANAMVDEGEAPAVRRLLVEDALVRQFNRSQREDVSRLRSRVAGYSLLSARGYLATPGTMAGDIAQDIRDMALPDEVRRQLTLGDADALKRANTTADKWISTSLFTSGNEPVGVIVLLDAGVTPRGASDDQSTDGTTTASPQLVFILVRGQLEGGRFVVRQLCYGNPLPLDAGTAKSD